MSGEHIHLPPPIVAGPTYAPLPAANGAAPTEVRQQPATSPQPTPQPIETKDNLREIVETVVFVIVLVLLLKSFVAEAFVIPTGSMAPTLYGYQKIVNCPECAIDFPVNASGEVEKHISVTECVCPNCRAAIHLSDHLGSGTGDRVLVDKSLYDLTEDPGRFDVVVFKFPGDLARSLPGPQDKFVPINYIKRLVGKPGETIAIHGGDLYRTVDLHYQDRPQPLTPDELREGRFKNDLDAVQLFEAQKADRFDHKVNDRGFEIIRKAPDKVLALRRLVFDNDHQARDLRSHPPRWHADPAWNLDTPRQARRFAHPSTGSTIDWLTYRHILRKPDQPQLITDFLGYNSGKPGRQYLNWVGDLILECDAILDSAEGQLVLDLAKGVDRFQASWDLSTGVCSLRRQTEGSTEELESKPTSMRKPGVYRLRFANVDERLMVWVDGKLVFGDGVSFRPPLLRGPTRNDLEPARIGASGGVNVEHLTLWRDTYYTTGQNSAVSDADAGSGEEWSQDSASWSEPDKWGPLHQLPVTTMYVQPGHYLCMGDNSPESSDGRTWGLVPRRLLLGRALLVYYPLQRAGLIR